MSADRATVGLDFDVEGLALDVFELADSGLEVESLTAGHAITENGASKPVVWPACGCSCTCSVQRPT
jgi:hypothetical protein